MDNDNPIAVLFDFDGVVMDTESQYSLFWHRIGVEHFGMDDFEDRIKGATLASIFAKYFTGKERLQAEIIPALDRYEQEMAFEYIPGFLDFMDDLRRHGCYTAIVTSSGERKMQAVCQAHPEMKTLFHRIFTDKMFRASKPAPDCYLLGMETFGTTPETTYVFEDSFNGLKAGLASGAVVIGLSTTNPADVIAPLCHHVIPDFQGFTFDKMTRVDK